MAMEAPEPRPQKRPRVLNPVLERKQRIEMAPAEKVDKVFEMRSVQASAFKHLFEILGCFLEDMNVVLTSDGMEIRTMDRAHVALAHLRIDVAALQKFSVLRPMVIGLNLRQLNTLMRAATNDDHIHFYIEAANVHRLHIGFESDSKTLYFEYLLLDLEDTPVSMPSIPYDISINISSQDMHRYLRDMSPVGDEICISVGKGENPQITMTVRGDYANGRLNLKEILNKDAVDHRLVETDGSDIADTGLSIVYPLSYLLTFSRACVLGPSVSVYLKREFPIMLSYTFADMGILAFMVAPKVEPEN